MLSAGVAWRLPPVRPPALPLESSPVCGVMCCAACCVVYTRSVVGFMWLGFVLTNLVVGSHGCFVRVGCGVSLTPLVVGIKNNSVEYKNESANAHYKLGHRTSIFLGFKSVHRTTILQSS